MFFTLDGGLSTSTNNVDGVLQDLKMYACDFFPIDVIGSLVQLTH